MRKSHEMPFSECFRNSEGHPHYPVTIGSKLWIKECRFVEVLACCYLAQVGSMGCGFSTRFTDGSQRVLCFVCQCQTRKAFALGRSSHRLVGSHTTRKQLLAT